jgi:diguanylate cyclase (GGDEF)-like protein
MTNPLHAAQMPVEHEEEMLRSTFRNRPELLLGLYVGVFALVLLIKPGSETTFAGITDILGTVPPIFGGVVALYAAAAAGGRARRGWLLLGLGCLFWGSGEVIWSFYEIVLGQSNPFPSWADVAYLSAVPLLFAGILVLTAPPSWSARLRHGLDALAIVAAAGALSWHFVIGPIYAASDASTVEKLLSSAYPLSDLVLLFALAMSAPRLIRDRSGQILGLFGAGMLLFLMADSGFAYLETVEATYESGAIVDLGWVAATCLFAYAARRQYLLQPDYEDIRPDTLASVSAFQVLPILLLPLILGWPLLLEALGSPMLEAPTLVFIYAFAVIVVMRQATALLDSVSLNRHLAVSNATLEVRTEVLSERLVQEEKAANLDWLTGALSRRAIEMELERLTAPLEDASVALGVVDLDGLKIVNDRDGHAVGDQVLRLVSTALSMDGAIVGRTGGDEFLVLLPEAHEAEVLAYLSIVDWRLTSLAAREEMPPPRISSGFALYPLQAQATQELLDLADRRMYAQKNQKKGEGDSAGFWQAA